MRAPSAFGGVYRSGTGTGRSPLLDAMVTGVDRDCAQHDSHMASFGDAANDVEKPELLTDRAGAPGSGSSRNKRERDENVMA
jgi:hypothetical protein